MTNSTVTEFPKGRKPKQSPDSWQAGLIVSERDRSPKGCLSNAMDALTFAPVWEDVIALDEFAMAVMCVAPPPWFPWEKEDQWKPRRWTDTDDIRTAQWLQKQGIMVQVDTTAKAVQAVAESRRYHPVREYLQSLKWDGKRRLPTWTSRYLGVEQTIYTEAVGIRWMVSAVARIFQPGCKADCALILQGKQGLKKSTALKILGGKWFTDQIADLGSKDSSVDVQGAWIIELAELDSMSRGDVGTIKAFMSRAIDRFRPPYGARTIEFSRQCVFAGTVNPEGGFLKDATGARRFWPIMCGQADEQGLTQDRDQLWAEAVDFYLDGFPWYLDTEELNEAAAVEQAECYVGDLWDGKVEDFLFNRNSVTVPEILEYVGVPMAQQSVAHQSRIGRILTSIGWTKKRERIGQGKRSYCYVRP